MYGVGESKIEDRRKLRNERLLELYPHTVAEQVHSQLHLPPPSVGPPYRLYRSLRQGGVALEEILVEAEAGAAG